MSDDRKPLEALVSILARAHLHSPADQPPRAFLDQVRDGFRQYCDRHPYGDGPAHRFMLALVDEPERR
jgi:hypothetical protein